MILVITTNAVKKNDNIFFQTDDLFTNDFYMKYPYFVALILKMNPCQNGEIFRPEINRFYFLVKIIKTKIVVNFANWEHILYILGF